MPTNTLVFKVQDGDARAGFSRLKREVDQLDSEFEDTRSEAERAGRAIDQLGDEARESAREVDRLGGAARRNNSVWRDTNGRLRDARDRFVGAGQGAETLTRSLGGLKGVFAGLGIAVAARELLQFGAASIRAAGAMEGLRRGLAAIEGSNADQRLRDFNEIAQLPGLNTPQIIRYSNSLRAAGATTAEVDQIIVSFGQAIVGLGGSAADTSRAMLQLTQAFGENKISQENFSTIKELIPSFNRLAQEVYNTDGSMDALNKRFKDSGQTLGQFLLPVLARLREEIPAAPVDSYARSIDALGEEFQQFKIAIGTELLPVVSATARGLAALFDTMTKGVQVVSNFFDVVDEQHQALLNASESASEFAIRLADINTATGQSDAVNARIQTLHRLTTALRIEQSQLSQSSKEYLQYAERIRDANNELDTLRAIQGRGTDNTQLRTQRTDELQRTNAEIQRYETLLARAREEAVGRTNPAIQQLERRLTVSRAAAAALTREIELLKNGFQDFETDAATQAATNYTLELEKLKAVAEDTRSVFAASDTNQQVIPNFQAALAASNAYYSERIRQAETALEKEKEGTDAFNALQVQIFQLGRQRLTAQRQLETERTNILRTFTDERVNIERSENNAVIAGFTAVTRAAADAARTRIAFARQIAAIPDINAPEAQYGNFTSQLRQDFEATEQQGRSLLSVMREIVRFSLGPTGLDLEARIPDPGVRQQQIDDQIAAQVRAQQTLTDIRETAAEQGSQFLNRIRQNEDRDVQRSLRQQGRQYRQFANLVSNTFISLATGRAESFESVATAFIQQSIRIVLRALVEHQLQKRLDDTLTASRIANIQKVAAAQQASGLAGVGGIPGLGNIGNIGNLLSGGGLALGASALLFPEQIRNLTGGIKDEISGLLDNVSREPVVVRANIQNNLRIGENEAREISDMTAELRAEDRA